jgi:transmembrane sensor
MRQYSNYKLEDFLLDDDFRDSVTNPSAESEAYWQNVKQQTGHGPLMSQARKIIRVLVRDGENLSDQELEYELNRIIQTTQRSARNRWLWPSRFAAAASVLIAMGLGWQLYDKASKPESVRSYQQYIASADVPLQEINNHTSKPKHIILPDGSSARLMPSSSISYSKPFIKNHKREIYMQGEIFFNVQKDISNPFIVYANGLLTKVVGTSFLVKTLDQEVQVSVSSGQVTVLPIKHRDSQHVKNTELLLNPNQEALFSTKDNLISKSIVEVPAAVQKAPAVDLRAEEYPVTEEFSLLEKTYGIPIVFDNKALSQCLLRADFTTESFFEKLDVICKTIGATYEVKDGQVIISSPGCSN